MLSLDPLMPHSLLAVRHVIYDGCLWSLTCQRPDRRLLQDAGDVPDLLPIPVTARKAEPRLAITIGVTGWVTSAQDFQARCPHNLGVDNRTGQRAAPADCCVRAVKRGECSGSFALFEMCAGLASKSLRCGCSLSCGDFTKQACCPWQCNQIHITCMATRCIRAYAAQTVLAAPNSSVTELPAVSSRLPCILQVQAWTAAAAHHQPRCAGCLA